jgi:signal transduction histidine kinase
VEARQTAASHELDRLRDEVAGLRASRRRLAVVNDTERREIERELHQGVQQHLVALAANLQVAAGLLTADPPAARTLLEEMARDVDLALAEARDLAQHIYPPLLDSGGLAVAIRSAAARTNLRTRLDVEVPVACPPEIARAVYLCCLELFDHADGGTEAAVTVRGDAAGLAFEVVARCGRSDVDTVLLRDRIEALGGRLTVESPAGGTTRVAGTIPRSA